MSLDRDVQFLYEIGTLRLIPRQWRRFLTPEFANLAEHHFRVMWLSLVIASHENCTNTNKILKMALVHDIAESRAGDVDYLSRQYVERNEELGIQDMLKSTKLEKEMLEMWREYEKCESIEAKIVKDADSLDVDMELAEQAARGTNIKKMFEQRTRSTVKQKLYTKTAKKMWDEIYATNPHDWHIKGRNRINAGDWKS